ncbi:MAG: hypothetical protein RR662_08010, partial [Clostridia bacterium]
AKIQAFTDTAIKNTFVAQSAFKMQSETAQQIIHVVNGEYNLSFKYKKLLELAVCKIIINAKEILLDKLDYTEVDTTILVSTNSIAVQLVSDTNNACLIGDLMLIAGTSKQVYSINENESITTTVKISDSIEVNSSSSETSANFDNDGIRIKNANNKNVVAEFTKEGTNTAKITADNCFIAGILGQIVAGQGWFS